MPVQYWPRRIFTTGMSLLNTALAGRERKKYKQELASVDVQSPVFIIGHHRSGTTHLWRLLTYDKRFIYPKVTEVLFPHTMLTFETIAFCLANIFSPEKRPQDNVKHAAKSPLSEEWGLCAHTFLSTQMSRYFPQHRERFKYMLSLKEGTRQEKNQWKKAVHLIARKLLLQNGKNKTVLFKSPSNTAKIKLLVDLYPDAKFIHIYRNPYRVFKSSVKMEKEAIPFCCYQPKDLDGIEDYIIWQYREMYRTFFEDKHLIPNKNLTQISYEELVRNRAGTIKKIYRDLNLGSFDDVKPDLTEYIESVSDYKTNNYAELPPQKKKKIADAWLPYFKAFGYSTELGAPEAGSTAVSSVSPGKSVS